MCYFCHLKCSFYDCIAHKICYLAHCHLMRVLHSKDCDYFQHFPPFVATETERISVTSDEMYDSDIHKQQAIGLHTTLKWNYLTLSHHTLLNFRFDLFCFANLKCLHFVLFGSDWMVRY